MKKRDAIIYTVVTGLFSLFILSGAIMYFAKYEMVQEMYTKLSVPTEVIYPLGIVKILGIAALWLVKNPLLKKLAYVGFAINLVLAIAVHINAGDGEAFGPAIPLILLIISYWFYRRVNK